MDLVDIMADLEVPTEDPAALVLADTITIAPRWAAGIIDLPSAVVGITGPLIAVAAAVACSQYLELLPH